MLRIVAHIEQLLMVQDCIIVPGFGGFVLQSVPASYAPGENLFSPMRKEIVFNRTLQHNDGLLTESYRQRYQVDYPVAQAMLEEDVHALQAQLAEERQLSLGAVGTIALGPEGQMVFEPGRVHTFSLDSYGLPPFHFATLQSLEAATREEALLLAGKKKKKDTLYVPVNLHWVRGTVAAAAAIALFLLVSTPVKEVRPSAYTASFIPSEMVVYPATARTASSSADELAGEEKPETPAATSAGEALLSPKETPEATQLAPNALLTPKKETVTAAARSASRSAERNAPARAKATSPAKVTSPAKTTVSQASATTPAPAPKMYHIVIASFPTEAQAEAYMAGVDRNECKRLSRVVRDGRYRIYADKFDNRKEAEEYMATLRKNEKYKDAWLFISR